MPRVAGRNLDAAYAAGRFLDRQCVFGRHLDAAHVIGRFLDTARVFGRHLDASGRSDGRISPEDVGGVRISPEDVNRVRNAPENAGCVRMSPENSPASETCPATRFMARFETRWKYSPRRALLCYSATQGSSATNSRLTERSRHHDVHAQQLPHELVVA